MRVYPKFKRCLSLLMALAMLLSTALPVTAEEPAPEQTGELYAKVAGSENPVQELTVPAGESLQVELYFGDSPVTDSAELESAGLQLRNDGNGSFTISRADAESGTITHIASGSKIAVTFESSKESVNTEPPATETQPIAPAAENPSNAKLYVRAVGAETFSQSVTISVGTKIELYYGDLENNSLIPLEHTGYLAWGDFPLNAEGNGIFRLDGTAGNTYTVTYSGTSSSVTVTLEGSSGEAGNSGNPTLFATCYDNPPCTNYTLAPSSGDYFTFYYGDINNPSEQTKLGSDSVLSYDSTQISVDYTTDGWNVCVNPSATAEKVTISYQTGTFDILIDHSSGGGQQGGGQSGGQGGGGQQGPCLYATWIDGSDFFTRADGVGEDGIDLRLFFRDSNGVVTEITDSNLLSKSERVELTREGNSWNVKLFGSNTEGVVIYMYNGEPYSFQITKASGSQGGQGGGGQQGPQLFATRYDNPPCTSYTLAPGCGDNFILYYGDINKPSEANVLGSDSVLSYDKTYLDVEYTNGVWNISVKPSAPAGTVTISYAASDGSTGEFDVLISQSSGGSNNGSDSGNSDGSGGGDESNFTLFAYDGTNYVSELKLASATEEKLLTFYLGDINNPKDKDIISTANPNNPMPTSEDVNISASNMGFFVKLKDGKASGTISYTVNGKTYTFNVYISDSDDSGDSGSSDSGEPKLFARWASSPNSYMDYLTVPAGLDSPIEFCFGTPESYDVITHNDTALTAESSVILQKASTPVFGNDEHTFYVGHDGIGIGAVIYTVDDVDYKFYVIGNGEPAETDSVKLFARRPDNGDFVYSLELYQNAADEVEFCFGTTNDFDVIDMYDSALKSSGVAQISPAGSYAGSSATDLCHINVKGVGKGAITYTVSGVVYEFPVLGLEGNFNGGGGSPPSDGPNDQWAENIEGTVSGAPNGGTEVSGDWRVVIQHGNQKISVGIGQFFEKTQSFVAGFGDAYTNDRPLRFGFQFILAALVDEDTTQETPASQEFLDCISNVRFYIPYWKNEDGSTDVSNCMLNTNAERFDAYGLNTWRTVMVADHGKGFDCTLALDFTYTPKNGEPQNYTVYSTGRYHSGNLKEIDIHAGDASLGEDHPAYLNTAAKLNAVLQSRASLEAWLKEYFPDEYAIYNGAEQLRLHLPAVEYDDVIVINCPMPDGVWGKVPSVSIFGIGGFNYATPRTKMPGFLNLGGHGEVRNIHFVGNKSDKITYGNQSFTCGVLIDGPEGVWNDGGGVHNCIFENLDYGIYDTPTGYHGITSGCQFIRCEYGMYIDCQNKSEYTGGANNVHSGNTFNNCKFAVWVKSLPSYITPYSLRIVNNTFLNNKQDIKVTTPGRNYYYFYRNYYYGTYDEVSVHSDAQEGRAAIVDTENSGAVVVTSPSRRYQNSDELWIFEDSTSILNSEAASLAIAQEALTNLSKEKEIAVVDNAASGKAVAIWTFGTEGGAAE